MIRTISILLLFCASAMAQLTPSAMRNLQSVKRYPAVTSGLVAYYRMDGDNWLNAVAGTNSSYVGAPFFSFGGRFYEYSGGFGPIGTNTIRVDSGDLIKGLKEYTFCAWAWFNSMGSFVIIGERSIISEAKEFSVMFTQSDGSIYSATVRDATLNGWWRGNYSAAGVLAVSNWYFMVSVFNADANSGRPVNYVNGIFIPRVGAYADLGTVTNYPQSESIYIGNTHPNSLTSANMNGKINDACIYNRALSSNEVFQLYKGFTAPP